MSFVIQSQSRVDSISGWAITYSPSAIFNVHSGIQLGLEKRIRGLGYLELEYAWIYPQNWTRNRSGTRVKFGLKTHLGRSIVLLTMYYRRTDRDVTGWAFEEATGLNERIEFSRTKTLIGPALGWGYTLAVNEKWDVELVANLGLGRYKVVENNFPEGVLFEEDSLLFESFRRPGIYTYPIVGVSIKLKYQLGHNSTD